MNVHTILGGCNHLLLRFHRCLALFTLVVLPLSVSAQSSYQRLRDHVPPIVETAHQLGRVAQGESISLAISLSLRNEAKLGDLITRLYDPADALHGRFLTSQQFTAQFAPTRSDYERVASYLQAQGLRVTSRHANRLVLDVEASAGTVEAAFGVHLNRYQLPDGRVVRAPDRDPVVPVRLAAVFHSIVGLDDVGQWHSHVIRRPIPIAPRDNPFDVPLAGGGSGGFQPNETGSGPGGGLIPSDIRTAYNLTGATLTGAGQTLAVFELDGYTASDITGYETAFSLPNMPLQNVLVDNVTGAAGSGADEVTLDIELQIALAPHATKMLVYEGPNSGQGVIDTYNRIATDNLAKTISTSWGLAEGEVGGSFLTAENPIFQQMATQGQSIFAAAGDHGAYDNDSTLSVDDPGSQPYVVSVGGTTLTTNGAGGPWSSETTWDWGGGPGGYAGGGGISSYWTIPSYQSQVGVVTAASGASSTMRNVPDVSLDADPNSGYSIYFQGSWSSIFGGTSCAAPLWAAFTALVNQQRVALGKGPLGFANPSLYTVGVGARYTTDFHDIADGSNNLYYRAVTGYDLATGWGSYNGANLLSDLVGGPVTASVTFVKEDTTTEGTWKGVYGKEGYYVGGSTYSLPAYFTGSISGESTYTWAASTTDVRALQDAGAATGRVAACGYSSTSFTVNINLTDGQTHQIEVYCLDWDTTRRLQRIDVLDAGTGTLLDTRSLSSFHNGVYVIWDIKGNVQMRFTNLPTSQSCVLSGLFFR
jgi:subtilase family serine protease